MTEERRDSNREVAGWLATLPADTLATIENRPSETIVPTDGNTGGARALANLEALLGDIHRLEIGDVIAEGGMGVVRGAEQVALGRPVAIKTLRADRRGAALDLLREAWVTGSLEHPNIIPIHALELDAHGTPSIVMKRISGVEWSTLIRDEVAVARFGGGRDLLAWNIEILMRVLDALRFAHSHGILHRDLKPTNVMIGDFGEVYVLDWGIAVSLHDDGSGRFPLAINATALAGTPAYMAPEMLGREGAPPLSERTDVYLAGAVLHEVIAGKPPHTGTNILAVVTSVVTSRPELPATAPAELAQICTRALQADPADRFASVDELRRALRDFLEHRGSDHILVRASERLVELRAKLREPDAAAEDIYRLFGACRYGFRDALAVWPDNEAAAAGLVDAVVAVAEYELAAGHPHAAVSLLGELAEPHPLLERARAEAAKQAERVAQLELIGRQHDRSIGARTRMALTAVFGTLFTAVPIVIAMVPALTYSPHWFIGVLGVCVMSVFLVAIWWARDSVRATAINRRLAATIIFMFLLQSLIFFTAEMTNRPRLEAYTWNLLLYTAIAGMIAIAVDRFLWPAVLAYLVSFVVASDDGILALYLAGICNGLFCAIGVWRWKPASLRYTAEEREAHRQRQRER